MIQAPFGFWAPKPGSILPDGSIAGSRQGPAVLAHAYGDIYLSPKRAEIATRFGWEIIAVGINGFVVVSKRPPRCQA